MTDFEISAIKRQWEAGVPIKQIARTMPHKHSTALKYIWQLQREGVLLERPRKCGRDLVVDAYNNGMHNPYEIAETYGYAVSTVNEYLKKANLGRKRECNWKVREYDDKTKKILESLSNGVSMSETARRFGVSRQWVYIVKKRSEDYGEYCRSRKRN